MAAAERRNLTLCGNRHMSNDVTARLVSEVAVLYCDIS